MNDQTQTSNDELPGIPCTDCGELITDMRSIGITTDNRDGEPVAFHRFCPGDNKMKSVFAVMPGREYKGGTLGMSVKVLYVQNGRVYYRRSNPPPRFGFIFSKPVKEFQEWLTM